MWRCNACETWRCPFCESDTDGDVCKICGSPKPTAGAGGTTGSKNETGPNKSPKAGKKKTLTIAAIGLAAVACIILLVIGQGGILPDGKYRVNAMLDSSLSLVPTENGDGFRLQNVGTASLPLQLEYLGENVYKITDTLSGLAMAAANDPGTRGPEMCLQKYDGSGNQLWRIVDAGARAYYIVNYASGMYLGVVDANAYEGALVKLFERNDAYEAHKWYFITGTSAAQGGLPVKPGEITGSTGHTADDVYFAGYPPMQVSNDFVLTYGIEEKVLDFRAVDFSIYRGSLGTRVKGTATVQLVDYITRETIAEQACAGDASIVFTDFPDGTYYFYVECDGYETYISEAVSYVHIPGGYDGNGQIWEADLVPVGAIYCEPFSVRVIDESGGVPEGLGVNFGVRDVGGGIPSYGWGTVNADGYLTTWSMENGVDVYYVLEFSICSGRSFEIYADENYVTVSPPETGNETVVLWP